MSDEAQPPGSFGQILEAIEQLCHEDRAALVDIVRKRVAAVERRRVVADIVGSQHEFDSGLTEKCTPDELMSLIYERPQNP